jgi:hypothetical protein
MTSETTGAVIAAPTTSLPEDSAILNAGLAEHGPREVAPIAQFVRYHRKGTPGLDECRPLTRDGAAISWRAARYCSGWLGSSNASEGRSISGARLVAERRELRLEFEGADELARWSLECQLGDGSFLRVFGRRLDLQVAPVTSSSASRTSAQSAA